MWLAWSATAFRIFSDFLTSFGNLGASFAPSNILLYWISKCLNKWPWQCCTCYTHCVRVPGWCCANENPHRGMTICIFLSWYRQSGSSSIFFSLLWMVCKLVLSSLPNCMGIDWSAVYSEGLDYSCRGASSGLDIWRQDGVVRRTGIRHLAASYLCHLAPTLGFLLPAVGMMLTFSLRGMLWTSVIQ